MSTALQATFVNNSSRIASTVGSLLLLHLAVGLTAPFIILHSVTGSRGFLVTAASNAFQVRTAIFLLFIGSAMAIAASAAVFPILRQHSSPIALWLFALSVAAFSLQAVDNGRLLAMLSLSQQYADTGRGNSEMFQILAAVVGSARKWAHYTYLFVAVSWITLLFASLSRYRLVPRTLGVLGIVCSLLQMAGVSVRGILGYAPDTRLAMPLAPAYIGLALWLIVKGFDNRETRVEANTMTA
jgi:Domain of unknown function (DUF4386)